MYMAPEVFRGEAYKESVDVFSFALVLLEIVGGIDVLELFKMEGVEPRSAASFHSRGKRLALTKLRLDVKTAEEAAALNLVEKCWDEDASARPSMSECYETLVSSARSTKNPKPSSGSFKFRQTRERHMETELSIVMPESNLSKRTGKDDTTAVEATAASDGTAIAEKVTDEETMEKLRRENKELRNRVKALEEDNAGLRQRAVAAEAAKETVEWG